MQKEFQYKLQKYNLIDILLKKYVNSEGKFYYLYNDILIVPIRIFYGKSENEIWLEYEFSAQTLSTPYFRESKCQETNCRVRANGKIDTSYVIQENRLFIQPVFYLKW